MYIDIYICICICIYVYIYICIQSVHLQKGSIWLSTISEMIGS